MRLPDFKVEQLMNDYENDAIYNMTDTCVKSLTLQELLDLEDFDFSNLILDYGRAGMSYMDDVRVTGNQLRGTFFLTSDSRGFNFILGME